MNLNRVILNLNTSQTLKGSLNHYTKQSNDNQENPAFQKSYQTPTSKIDSTQQCSINIRPGDTVEIVDSQDHRGIGGDSVNKRLLFTSHTDLPLRQGADQKRQTSTRRTDQYQSPSMACMDLKAQTKTKYKESKVMERIRSKVAKLESVNGNDLKSNNSSNSFIIIQSQSQIPVNLKCKLNRENSMILSQERVTKKVIIDTACSRLYEDDKRRQAMRKEMEAKKKEKADREGEGLTFTPQTNRKGVIKQQIRSDDVKNFFNEQLAFQKIVEIKIQTNRENQVKSELSYMKNSQPKASIGSQKIIQNIKGMGERDLTPDVHQRLYKGESLLKSSRSNDRFHFATLNNNDHHKESQVKKESDQQQHIQRLLSEGRRKDSKITRLQQQYKYSLKLNYSDQQRLHNNKLVFQKLQNDIQKYFNKDLYFNSLYDAAEETNFERSLCQNGFNISISAATPKSTNEKSAAALKRGTPIKLKTYLSLMYELGFICLKKSSEQEEKLLTNLWSILGGTNENTVKAENLLILLAAVMNAQVPQVLQEHGQDTQDGHQRMGMLCVDENDNAHFMNADDILKVHQRFFRIASNRKNKPSTIKQNTKAAEFPFKPDCSKVNKKSTKDQKQMVKHSINSKIVDTNNYKIGVNQRVSNQLNDKAVIQTSLNSLKQSYSTKTLSQTSNKSKITESTMTQGRNQQSTFYNAHKLRNNEHIHDSYQAESQRIISKEFSEYQTSNKSSFIEDTKGYSRNQNTLGSIGGTGDQYYSRKQVIYEANSSLKGVLEVPKDDSILNVPIKSQGSFTKLDTQVQTYKQEVDSQASNQILKAIIQTSDELTLKEDDDPEVIAQILAKKNKLC